MQRLCPIDCIDCEECVPECPVDAISAEAAVPARWARFIELNVECATALKENGEGHIDEKQDPTLGPECKEKG